MKAQRILIPLLTAGALASGTAARANLLTGSLWDASSSGLDDTTHQSIPENGSGVPILPGGAPNVTFSVNTSGGLDFDSRNAGNGYTIGGFLGTGGATVLTGGTSTELALTMDDVLISIVGQVTVTTGETFTSSHDDGMVLFIDGQSVINVPGPTAPVTTPGTWTGPSGTFNFQLTYAEVDGAPGVMDIDNLLNNATNVPEPGTMLAGATLLLPLTAGAIRFRRNSKQAD
jgi:hypothetical protein